MGVYYLKENDTGTVMQVALKNPDDTVHVLTGKSVDLNIWLSDGTKLTPKVMTVSDAANGIVQYAWVAGDWGAAGLVKGPSLPLAPGEREHRMEYQATTTATGVKITFPNDGYDTLRIYEESE